MFSCFEGFSYNRMYGLDHARLVWNQQTKWSLWSQFCTTLMKYWGCELFNEQFYLTYRVRDSKSQYIMKGSQGRNLNARTDAETIEKTCFLACLHDLLSLLFCITKHHLPRWHCLQWSGLLKSTIHYKENAPLTCLQANMMEVFPQLRFLSPDYFSCVKLTESITSTTHTYNYINR